MQQALIAQEQAIEIARQDRKIAIQNKSRDESQAKAEADKEAASNRAEAVRMEAKGNAEAAKLIAEAARIPFDKVSGPIAGSVLLCDETINVVANQIA